MRADGNSIPYFRGRIEGVGIILFQKIGGRWSSPGIIFNRSNPGKVGYLQDGKSVVINSDVIRVPRKLKF